MRHNLSNNEYAGYGVYEYGSEMNGFGQLPNLDALQSYTVVGGLAEIDPASKPVAKRALQTMKFTPISAPEIGGVSGSASYELGNFGSPWVDELVGRGYVVMVERSSVNSGTVRVMATDLPNTIVLFAKAPPGTWVIVDGDPGALNQARALASGGVMPGVPGGAPGIPAGIPPVPGGIPGIPGGIPGIPGGIPGIPGGIPGIPGGGAPAVPGGTPGVPGGIPGQTQPQPPPPQPQPGPRPQTKTGSFPSWVLPVAIGAGVIGIGVVVYGRSRRPRAMSANRRHYKGWG